MIRDILFQLFPLAAAFFMGSEEPKLINAAVLTKLYATLLFSSIGLNHRMMAPTFDIDKLKQLLSYGGSVTGTNIIAPILTSVDRFFYWGFGRCKSSVMVYHSSLTLQQR